MTGRQRSRPRSTDGGVDEEETDDPATEVEPDDTDTETGATPEETDDEGDHLEDLKDGAGCTEIWEHLSENRDG
ncbi:hypothetical protein [Halorubrum aethiopicum]|uniref:hypothetical protein n=1 Tax=Halorubrum aethiopicum TaxID=1758255 RepID=UPI00082D37D4|nr:hypothetical protein [Halorubrum aethiopicum]